ncbi:uncharacterized protein [Cicer arietinum]|uniref:Uncharacterized protein LOC101505273 n=1 Tax=Cicer arietinum TaxID=3827 RepID=A0A3Q7YGW7_CICAR|nr:uncharacterized protein LOC101505273 [Cicer arietinum]
MAAGFSYWDDCVDPEDLEAMWNVPEVSAEWLKAGEAKGRKVHLSRDPDGQPYLTQTEMRAVADIVISRHFQSEINLGMICAIAELESDRQLLVLNSGHKSKEPNVGLMQLLPKTVEWLISALGYRSYAAEENIEYLFKPFINVYFAAAYLKWLSKFDNKERNEEFMVRAYRGGTKKVTHKSTLPYWKSYLSVKESFRCRKSLDDSPPLTNVVAPVHSHTGSPIPSEHSKGQFLSLTNTPILTCYFSRAVAEVVLFKHLTTTKVKPTVLCAIAEVSSMRFVHGVGARPGIMGIDYSTAFWLYMELGFMAYKLETVDDLSNPFVSMYFGAAYVAWLSEYEGRERTPEFFVQAYFVGPKQVNPQDTSTLWLKFEEALSKYEEERKRNGGDSCSIM